jgi:quinol monooxygenase YgiN
MWNSRDGFTCAENKENAMRVKRELEALLAVIDGIIGLDVHINEMASSNKDVILDSLFESEEALAAYQAHPEHQRVSAFVGTVLQGRSCFDYVCD